MLKQTLQNKAIMRTDSHKGGAAVAKPAGKAKPPKKAKPAAKK